MYNYTIIHVCSKAKQLKIQLTSVFTSECHSQSSDSTLILSRDPRRSQKVLEDPLCLFYISPLISEFYSNLRARLSLHFFGNLGLEILRRGRRTREMLKQRAFRPQRDREKKRLLPQRANPFSLCFFLSVSPGGPRRAGLNPFRLFERDQRTPARNPYSPAVRAFRPVKGVAV